jgi:hypothetical protein
MRPKRERRIFRDVVSPPNVSSTKQADEAAFEQRDLIDDDETKGEEFSRAP